MDIQPNSKIMGACLVGVALVAGAYLATNFGKPTGVFTPTENIVTDSVAPTRNAIAVFDEDENGIEDWRDDFITTEPIVINSAINKEYVPPSTLTGQTGINFMEEILLARSYGNSGRSNDEIVAKTVTALEKETGYSLYDTPDISIKTTWNEADIKNYANTVAQVVLVDTETDKDHELLILQDILNRNDKERINELAEIALIYSIARDTMLTIPVPAPFVKEHLDLINTLHAVQKDIEGMTFSFTDPVYALLRLKRYEDDAQGLYLALQNLYKTLVPYAKLFTAQDTAVLFVTYSPANNKQI